MLIAVFNENVIMREFRGMDFRFIDGKIRSKSECCGFCNCDKHKGCLSYKQMQEHKCNEKGCHHLFDIADPYKELEKRERKEKKRVKQREEGMLLEACRESLNDMEGVKVTGINIEEAGVVTAEYVSICSVDEKEIAEAINGGVKGYRVRLVHRKVDFDRAVEMIYGGKLS